MNCLYIVVVLLAKVIDDRDAQPASQPASPLARVDAPRGHDLSLGEAVVLAERCACAWPDRSVLRDVAKVVDV